MELIKKDIKPRDIVTIEAIDNAFALGYGDGWFYEYSTAHTGMAHEAGIEYPIERINEVAKRVPHLAKLAPASDYHIEDVHNAGGVSAIINELLQETRCIRR